MEGARTETEAVTEVRNLAAAPAGTVIAVVKDLFFVARIRETARLGEVPLLFARSPEELDAAVLRSPRFVLVDLTAGFDYERIFGITERATIPVLAFTTHVLARRTQPWHGRCRQVVTKERLSQELGSLLQEGPRA